MAKSALEKQLEKQGKEAKERARKETLRQNAQSIINGYSYIGDFRVLDNEAEVVLKHILDQYDGNENNFVGHHAETLPRPIYESLSLQYEKLKLCGMITITVNYPKGAMITLMDSGKKYFEDKKSAIERQNKMLQYGNNAERSVEHKKYDVFISHANKDKIDFVDLLYAEVRHLGINIFYDTDVISWGDKWKDVIINGTKESEFAIIVISENFFDREWTEKELKEFLLQQNESGQKIILPLLYNISLDELKAHYPELGDIQCISVDKYSKEEITILLAKELIKRYK